MKLYTELAEWWPIFSGPEEYREEAAFFARVLKESCNPAPRTLLELGSGGGNNASHLKSHFKMTLVDVSPQMLAVSRALNPDCEHCRPGGVALFVPDEVRESFVPSTDHGGNDSARGSVRYVQWTTDPDPSDTTIQVDFGILIRDDQGDMRVLHERHTHGLFARSLWLRLLRKVGFKPSVVRDEYVRDVFLARRQP